MFQSLRTPWSSLVVPSTFAILLVLGVCSALYLREAEQISSYNLDLENRRAERFTGLFGHEVASAISDLRLLATGDGFQDYLASGQPANLERATRRAVYFSKDNPDYDKIRYIDEKGQEIIRINHDGAIVPPDQLQNKADRPFFQRTNNLEPGQVYISTIDLNVENGALEQPIKPTYRVALPVFDTGGRRRGIYVINFLAANSIERLRAFTPRYRQRFRLLNAEGYWLAGENPQQEWGFMLPGRSGMTLARTDPDLWSMIRASPSGQVPYRGGYFTWDRAVPRDFYTNKSVTVVSDDDFFVFATVITPQEWAAYFLRLRQTFTVVALLLLVLATALSWIYQARRRANQERDRFFNVTRDMLCVAGFDGYFKRVNPAWEKALGYSTEEMRLKPFLDFVHPEDRQKTVAQMANLSQGKEVILFENRYQCKDGTYRWLLWSAQPLLEEKLIYGSARDLTERKQIEEKLRESDERLRQMVESVKDYAIFMLDPAGRVMSWNSGAQRIYGFTAEEIVGRHFDCFYPDQQKIDRFPDKELLASAEKGRFEDEGIRLRQDRSTFWANVVTNAVRNSQGDLLGFVNVTRDVTARVEAAASIDKLHRELKQRADLLEVANKELESFSYSVSHDLRAPLRHIHGFVELLQKSPALQQDSSAQRFMGVISKAAKEMGLLIDDLIAFSRTGRAEMNPVKIDMDQMVAQIIRDFEMDLRERNVHWDIKPLSSASGDPGLIRLVWTNLLGNAIKYTRPRPEAKIEVGQLTAATAPAGGVNEVVYYVRDNGVGFNMQYAAKLFGVFQRLHRAEDFEGTGIGLANVQRIIFRHGGRVWAEGQVDGGATFFFSLPVTPSP